ncbi:NAD-dependent epimerase/dehydratase family protein [Exiguobacterium sp. s129]|uniref:polysaccharide biosynthesis C-terminal domain-containing protein n=1 Tax=Exiguobacterium sp. s129 TaxID=2751264 RepID=UPI001BE69C93|nr:NAD-dependent epimerase/dehydratase family protein [Exiguobacterium sp. s129]
MNILLTGANGFVGKNLRAALETEGHNVFAQTRETDEETFMTYCRNAEFIYHLAGVNRPKEENEFFEGNVGFTAHLLEILTQAKNQAPIVYASSVQAELDNPYGQSKREAERLLFEEGERTGRRVMIYRLPNLFGKWSRPHYNSVVSTFCDRVAKEEPIEIHDPNRTVTLAYIDDVMKSFLHALSHPTDTGYQHVPTHEPISLGRLADLLYTFRDSRNTLSIPALDDAFTKQLYSTYLSYLPVDAFGYDLLKHEDERGSFTEFIRTPDRGQVSVNVAKPGITKGNHWHHTKNEKFLVVSGEAKIHFRKVGEQEVHSYFVTGEMMRVVDIPVGYTHSIENVGTGDLVTVMWVNEVFNPDEPDTYFMEVQDETTQSDDHRRDETRDHTPIGRHS